MNTLGAARTSLPRRNPRATSRETTVRSEPIARTPRLRPVVRTHVSISCITYIYDLTHLHPRSVRVPRRECDGQIARAPRSNMQYSVQLYHTLPPRTSRPASCREAPRSHSVDASPLPAEASSSSEADASSEAKASMLPSASAPSCASSAPTYTRHEGVSSWASLEGEALPSLPPRRRPSSSLFDRAGRMAQLAASGCFGLTEAGEPGLELCVRG